MVLSKSEVTAMLFTHRVFNAGGVRNSTTSSITGIPTRKKIRKGTELTKPQET